MRRLLSLLRLILFKDWDQPETRPVRRKARRVIL